MREARKANQALDDLLGQIALVWLVVQKPGIATIPGTTKLHRVEENLGPASIEMTTDDLREITIPMKVMKIGG